MKIVICSHAKMAEGVFSALRLIGGEHKDVQYLNAYTENSDFKNDLRNLIVDDDTEYCIITDLLGGSVNQEVMQYLRKKNVYIVTGMNLPLVLQLVIENEATGLNAESIKQAVQEARQQIVFVNEIIHGHDSKDDFEE